MIDPFNRDAGQELPPELAALDQELSAIDIEERQSFGPELEAQLGQEQQRPIEPRRVPTWVRRATSAAAGALLATVLTVPPARAALVRFLVAVQDGAFVVFTGPSEGVTSTLELAEPGLEVSLDEVPLALPPAVDPFEKGGLLSEPEMMSFPEIRDRAATEDVIRQFYPLSLQRRGIGGTVALLLWVDSSGQVDEVQVDRSSGVPELDRAALAAARLLGFDPARRRGRAVESWVEFDVRFRPRVERSDDIPSAPDVIFPDGMEFDDPAAVTVGAALNVDELVPPAAMDARDLLRSAFDGDDDVEARLGSFDGLLIGETPESEAPLRWRIEASEGLQEAITRDPENPAPFLALGRLRRKQGLRSDARRLFERGIQRAERIQRPISPRVLADLNYERADISREEWVAWRSFGQIPMVALSLSRCFRASAQPARAIYAGSELLIQWNYLCPGQLDELMQTRFESLESQRESERQEMLGFYLSAIEAFPGHPDANTQFLLALADLGDWEGVLEGAKRFQRSSGGHPSSLLLQGLALQRMGRSAEAEPAFAQALLALPTPVVAAMRDVTPLMGEERAEGFASLGEEARRLAGERFFDPLDPIFSTAVNERETEHLARAAYAEMRYGGAATDAGVVWVRYGRPNAIHAIGDGSGLRTEFWDYGPGPDLTFRRPSVNLELGLTSEGLAYLEELRTVFPHRYDAGDRELVPLPAQLASFRNTEGAGIEFEIHTRVPAELVATKADQLDVGLFLVTASGERRIVHRERIPARESAIHLNVALPPGVSRVVLEVVNPVSGRVAALRSPVVVEGTIGLRSTISDLLFVEPKAPYSAVGISRDAGWLEARTVPGTPERGEAAVVFEIYDLERGDARYWVSATVENMADGVRTTIPVKPAGELEYRTTWDRSRREAGQVTEYLSLNLNGLTPGSYVLRVRVGRPGSADFVERDRGLRVR